MSEPVEEVDVALWVLEKETNLSTASLKAIEEAIESDRLEVVTRYRPCRHYVEAACSLRDQHCPYWSEWRWKHCIDYEPDKQATKGNQP